MKLYTTDGVVEYCFEPICKNRREAVEEQAKLRIKRGTPHEGEVYFYEPDE